MRTGDYYVKKKNGECVPCQITFITSDDVTVVSIIDDKEETVSEADFFAHFAQDAKAFVKILQQHLLDFVLTNSLTEKSTYNKIKYIKYHLIEVQQTIKPKILKSHELKHMIISNFIDYWTSDKVERVKMTDCLNDYVEGDHVNELKFLD